MTLTLDANVFVDLANRHPAVRAAHRTALKQGEALVLSVIAWQELRVGALLERHGPETQAALDELIAGVPVIDYDTADAEAAATLRSRSARGDTGVHDLMIAGQAIARGWTVVTGNARDFARLDGLSYVDWRLEV